jgi:hypothetical protein
MTPNMQPVEDSSMISAAGFDDGELYITFAKGQTTYAYPCTQSQYDDFQSAESKGSWFHANIRGQKIEGRKIEAEAVGA